MKITTYLPLAILLFTAGVQAQNLDGETNATTTKSKEIVGYSSNTTEPSVEKLFYSNAKLAGLTEEKTKELIKIINERNEVLKDLDTRKKQANAPFSVQDPGTLYNFKINEARNYYARKISGLLTYSQYTYFVIDNYKEEAEEKSKSEYNSLLKSNPGLTKDQKTKLYDLIYNYNLNQLVTTAYFSYDKNVQKPKLGLLRFNFEKEFAKTCKEYNIKITESKQANNTNSNNFQWN